MLTILSFTGLLHTQHKSTHQMDSVGHKISLLLKDEDAGVKIKASEALGYIYGEC